MGGEYRDVAAKTLILRDPCLETCALPVAERYRDGDYAGSMRE